MASQLSPRQFDLIECPTFCSIFTTIFPSCFRASISR